MILVIFLQTFTILWITPIQALESSFPLTVLPLQFKENPATNQRIYFTENSVLGSFKSSNFTSPTNSTTPLYGLATPDTDCEVIDTLCPQLTRVFHVSVNGSPRLAVWKDVENNDTLEIVDEAGYVAEWPGYCGTADGALVEMYSPILATIRYVSTNEEIERARWNTDRMFWRPTKVLGYLFDAKEPKRTVKYPFNAIRPFENPVFNKISITLRPIIRVKSPSGYVAFTTSFRNNEYLVDYKFDKVFNVSLVDQTTNVTVIGDACGQMTLLYEVFDPTKMTYRLKTPASLAPTEESRQSWSLLPLLVA